MPQCMVFVIPHRTNMVSMYTIAWCFFFFHLYEVCVRQLTKCLRFFIIFCKECLFMFFVFSQGRFCLYLLHNTMNTYYESYVRISQVEERFVFLLYFLYTSYYIFLSCSKLRAFLFLFICL